MSAGTGNQGRAIPVDGKSTAVIGVMPGSFRFLVQNHSDLVLPLRFDRAKTTLGDFRYQMVVRLKPGVTIAQASADIARMIPIVLTSFPVPPGYSISLFHHASLAPIVRPLEDDVVGDVGKLCGC